MAEPRLSSDPITLAEAIKLAEREYGTRRSQYGPYCTHVGADRDTHFSHSHPTLHEAEECCKRRREDLVHRLMSGERCFGREPSGRPYLP